MHGGHICSGVPSSPVFVNMLVPVSATDYVEKDDGAYKYRDAGR